MIYDLNAKSSKLPNWCILCYGWNHLETFLHLIKWPTDVKLCDGVAGVVSHNLFTASFTSLSHCLPVQNVQTGTKLKKSIYFLFSSSREQVQNLIK